ncbi:MAG TPA: ABC transporter permease [Thermoanaerobaculia bacterium]|jgi:putative ABC transport system permease protein|nr:ABC transporter permease [Thermoanaerobaculia bacterium]
MSTLLQSIRLGVRMLRKYPTSTAIALIALSLGIGLTTAAFSIVYGVFLRGLPFPGADRLMRLESVDVAAGEPLPVSYLDFLEWRRQQTSFEGLAAWYGSSINVSGSGQRPEQYNGALVSDNLFDLVGVRPALGRSFRPGEDGPAAEPVVIIGHSLWRQRFNADPKVIGRTLRVEGNEMTIVGVMPEKFGFPLRQEIWVPFRMDATGMERGMDMPVQVFGRLKEGVSREQALAELRAIAGRIAQAYPKTNEGISASVTPYVEGYTEEMRSPLYTMLAAVSGVLLIACANVAMLLLLRATRRSHEVAVRMALGASRSQVRFQFLVEALCLTAAGAVLGLLVAEAGIALYLHFLEPPSFWMEVRLDPEIFLFVLGLAMVSGLLAGTFPAFQAGRTDANTVLNDPSRGISNRKLGRLSQLLVIAEITLSCGLLVAMGLLTRSVLNLQRVDLGFSTRDVFTARISLSYSRYPDTASKSRFYDELLRRLQALPGVASAGVVSSLPGDMSYPSSFEIEGAPSEAGAELPKVPVSTISPGFFDTLGVRMLRGRDFGAADREGSMLAAVVSRSFAERYFPGKDPLGRRLRVVKSTSGPWLTIVGVAPDLAVGQLVSSDRTALFVPLGQNPINWVSLVLRTRGAPSEMTETVAKEVAAMDPDMPVFAPDTLEQRVAGQRVQYEVLGTLFTILGFAALFLSMLGLYGVMAFAVARKTPEIGLRMALGAKVGDILRLIFRGGLVQLAIGIVLGLGLAGWLTRLLSAFLFNVQPWDPAIFVLAGSLVAAIGFVACLLPAKRAAGIDPVLALKNE